MTQEIKVPHMENIASLVEKTLTIKGCPLASPTHFTVSLVCGDKETCDKAARFDFIFKFNDDENITICDSKIYGNDNKKVLISDQKFPFVAEKDFKLEISAMKDKYSVIVDSVNYFDFPFRALVDRVTYVLVEGDIKLHSIK